MVKCLVHITKSAHQLISILHSVSGVNASPAICVSALQVVVISVNPTPATVYPAFLPPCPGTNILTALSNVKRPEANQTSITLCTVLVFPASLVGVTELFNLIVGTAITPSQVLGAVIFVPSGICTLTGVVEMLVVTFRVISGTVATLLLHEVLTNGETLIVASVISEGTVIVVALVLDTSTSV